MNLKPTLENRSIQTSVPCRIDLGGTLDIATFYLPMAALNPSTVNIALDLRTHVTLTPWTQDRVKISSTGFESVEIQRRNASFDHAMGLMSAIVTYFDVHGVHVHIHSTSPPKSALGGSSCAAVALIAAFYLAMEKDLDPEHICWLAHHLEASVAGVPCGTQDQTAAAFGGVNLWEWTFGRTGPAFVRQPVCRTLEHIEELNDHILVAYCGIPHVSKDINGQWVKSFVKGDSRRAFERVAGLTRAFAGALKEKNFSLAGQLMNKETRIRSEITPQVLDKTGKKLFERAVAFKCGARFTGAGGGGCLWAVGEKEFIQSLSAEWKMILDRVDGAQLLNTRIDPQGIKYETQI
jgi:D-glycero-alpha-D-manno-heptose-7-phosphate kinase